MTIMQNQKESSTTWPYYISKKYRFSSYTHLNIQASQIIHPFQFPFCNFTFQSFIINSLKRSTCFENHLIFPVPLSTDEVSKFIRKVNAKHTSSSRSSEPWACIRQQTMCSCKWWDNIGTKNKREVYSHTC